MSDMPTPTPPEPVTWTVGIQTPATIRDATGQYVSGYNIPYKLSTGFSDTLFVPLADYTVDKVRQMLADATALHTEVGTLTGTVGGD
jgi:hypothetical protein